MVATRFLNPKNDIAFKKVFGSEKHKNILIHFLNDVLNFAGDDAIQDVEFLSPIQDPDIASKKMSAVDVLCKDAKGVRYIVEMQVDPVEGFEKRAQFYASKAYYRQVDKGQKEAGKYQNLKQVIFIAITDYVLFKEKEAYRSRHKLLDEVTYEWDLKDLSFVFIELGKFKIENVNELKTMLEKWCYFFKHAEEITPDELKALEKDEVIKAALEALDQFYWTEVELDLYEHELKRVWDNAAADAWRLAQMQKEISNAREAGEEAGKAAGRKKGREEGREAEKIAIATNALSLGLDIDSISKLTGLSKEVIETLKI